MCSPGHLCSHSPGTKGAQFPRLQPPPQLLVSFLVSPQSRKQSSVLSEGAGRKAAWNPASTWGGGGGTLLGPYGPGTLRHGLKGLASRPRVAVGAGTLPNIRFADF